MLPTFLLIGAQKAGSTTLWHYLRSHPEIFMPKGKELNFFAADMCGYRGLDWYERMFRTAGRAQAIGEASTLYTMHPTYAGVPARIAQVMPDAKLIYLVRDPIDRLVSQHTYERIKGRETRSLVEAVHADRTYIDTSRYAFQIEQYLPFFSREQMLIVTSEEFSSRPADITGVVCSFLGVDPYWQPPDLGVRLNVTAEKVVRRPWARTAARLAERRRLSYAAFRALRYASQRAPAPLDRAASGITHERPARPQAEAVPVDLRRELEARLRDDVRRLRPYVSGNFDGWGLLPASTTPRKSQHHPLTTRPASPRDN